MDSVVRAYSRVRNREGRALMDDWERGVLFGVFITAGIGSSLWFILWTLL